MSVSPVEVSPMDVLLLDPSLFTPAYDAGLSQGLRSAGVRPRWLVRPLRSGEAAELGADESEPMFYRGVERIPATKRRRRALAKGASHVSGLATLLREVRERRPSVVHVQWAVLPIIDTMAMRLVQRQCPVVMTVHDTVPFNGETISFLQNAGFDLPIKSADRVIVHTRAALDNLVKRGVDGARIRIVPHGPLQLRATARPVETARDPRWTFVLFGQLKPYKGLDLLVEALGRLTVDERVRARVIVAGAAQMDMEPIQARIAALGLGDTVELRLGRLDEQEMADLFAEADAFVFPYRQIDASGVYFLLKPLRKWMIASRVGIFAEDMREGVDGALVPAGDIDALAEALRTSIDGRLQASPASEGSDWSAIGHQTRAIYEEAIDERSGRGAKS